MKNLRTDYDFIHDIGVVISAVQLDAGLDLPLDIAGDVEAPGIFCALGQSKAVVIHLICVVNFAAFADRNIKHAVFVGKRCIAALQIGHKAVNSSILKGEIKKDVTVVYCLIGREDCNRAGQRGRNDITAKKNGAKEQSGNPGGALFFHIRAPSFLM